MRRIVIYIACALMVMAAGCKSNRSIAVVASKNYSVAKQDSANIIHAYRDSVQAMYIHDSTRVEKWHKDVLRGDSVVYSTDSVVREVIRYINQETKQSDIKHDTVRTCKTDTVYIKDEVPVEVPVPVPVEVDKYPFLRKSGIALWVIVGILLLSVLIGVVIKFAK